MASFIGSYVSALNAKELLVKLTWDDWLSVEAPYDRVKFSARDVTARYGRNGYEWDVHGTLYVPEKELDARRAFSMGAPAVRKSWTSLLTEDPDWAGFWLRRVLKSSLSPIPAITRRVAFGSNPLQNACRSIFSTVHCQRNRSSTEI